MLPTAAAAHAVAAAIRRYSVPSVVIDPVMISTSGHSLAAAEVMGAMVLELFPLATLITPNIPEASALLGGRQIASLEDMKAAAAELHRLGPKWVLVSGKLATSLGAIDTTNSVTLS